MRYKKPKLIKGVSSLPSVTAAFAQPASETCVEVDKSRRMKRKNND